MTTRIVITGAHLSAPIEIRERDVVAAFNVWSGPGTTMGGVEATDGFIVDWSPAQSSQPSAICGSSRFLSTQTTIPQARTVRSTSSRTALTD